MAAYRVLVVAPKTELPLAPDEVMQVVNTLGAKILQGHEATIHGFLNIIREPFDIVWFATHGDENGVYLSDGILHTSEITTMVRACGASLCVLNTCASRSVALTIFDELQIPLVCTLKKIPDRTAFITGTLLARHIANGLSFREAYEIAKPGRNSTYTYLPEEENFMPPPHPRGRFDLPEDADVTARLEQLVKELDMMVFGSKRPYVLGLIESNEKIVGQMAAMREELQQLKDNQKTNRMILIALCIIVFFLVVGIVSLGYMQGVWA